MQRHSLGATQCIQVAQWVRVRLAWPAWLAWQAWAVWAAPGEARRRARTARTDGSTARRTRRHMPTTTTSDAPRTTTSRCCSTSEQALLCVLLDYPCDSAQVHSVTRSLRVQFYTRSFLRYETSSKVVENSSKTISMDVTLSMDGFYCIEY